MPNPGAAQIYVTLSEIVDNTPTAFDPPDMWYAVRPAAPGPFDERKITLLLEGRYHPQMTMNTILTREDGGQMFVRGIQDVDLKHVTHVLFCEEVLTP